MLELTVHSVVYKYAVFYLKLPFFRELKVQRKMPHISRVSQRRAKDQWTLLPWWYNMGKIKGNLKISFWISNYRFYGLIIKCYSVIIDGIWVYWDQAIAWLNVYISSTRCSVAFIKSAHGLNLWHMLGKLLKVLPHLAGAYELANFLC